MTDIVVLGSANMDLVVRQPRLPVPGETMFGSSFTTVPGGKGLNQAVAAARAGASVAFAGALGSDAYGDELLDLLQREGIGTDAVTRSGEPTGTAHISVLDDGDNSIVVVSGANDADELTDAARAAVAGARFLVMQFERPQPLLLAASRFARERGVATVLTPAPASAPIEGLLELVDLLVPNAGEARQLSGVDDPEDAARALSGRLSDGGRVVLTRGGDAALVARGGSLEEPVAARAVTPVDTTAAGDTFTGVLVARLAARDPFERAASAASAAAAISVTRPGATPSMPAWRDIASAIWPARDAQRPLPNRCIPRIE